MLQKSKFDPHEPAEFLFHVIETMNEEIAEYGRVRRDGGAFLALDIIAKAAEVNLYHWFDR